MAQFTSKELYMMNGGNKLYIYKDGFGDDYDATAAEEAAWSQEVIAKALSEVDKETNVTSLQFAIDNLLFHKYKGVDQLLLDKIQNTSPVRTIVFATLLWKTKEYEKSFGIIYQLFLNHRDECIHEVFHALIDFKNNIAARKFLLECLRGDDVQLQAKAHTTLGMWAYTGMPELRAVGLLNELRSKDDPSFEAGIQQLRQLLFL
jgi:hypothetical protein